MSSETHIQARTDAILGEMAELGLLVIKELATRFRESEDREDAVAYNGALDKTYRSVRLTLALKDRLTRQAASDAKAEAQEAKAAEAAEAKAEAARAAETAREAARAAEAARPATPVEARKARVYNLLRRPLWNESEGEDETYEILTDELDSRLDEAARHPELLDLPLETLARRILADFGVAAPFKLSLCEPPRAAAPVPDPAVADTG